MPVPFFYKEFIQGNKMWSLFILYIAGNFFVANMIQTGGFEITVNGVLEYSKIETNEMPSLDTVKSILARYDVRI